MIYETLINIPNMYLVALGKQQSKQTEKKNQPGSRKNRGGRKYLKKAALQLVVGSPSVSSRMENVGSWGERTAWVKGWTIKSSTQRRVCLWLTVIR